MKGWIKATRHSDGRTVWVNLARACTMGETKDGTEIKFADGFQECVREEPSTLLQNSGLA
jgi:hypothetical protein